jgi:Tudor domain
VQFAQKSDQVDSVTRMLQETDLEPLSSDQIESGVRCVAKYPLDGCFYRAEILSVLDDDQIFVAFMDFGNTSPVVDLLEYMTFPSRLAITCRLDLAKCGPMGRPNSFPRWHKMETPNLRLRC